MIFSKRFNILFKLTPYLWPKDWKIRLRLVTAIFLLLATIALNVSVPLILKQVINILSTQPTALIFAELLLIAYSVVWTLSKITDQLRLTVMNRVIERGTRLLCLKVFDHLMSLSLSFHSSKKTGAI